MLNIQYWQLAADVGMIVALFYLAMRFIRSNSFYTQSKSEELHKALKSLIGEAEEAGRLLNERLIKRQQQLEKVLIELEGAEGKFEKVESSATRVLNDLKENERSASAIIEKFNKAVAQYSEMAMEVSVEGQAQPQPQINRSTSNNQNLPEYLNVASNQTAIQDNYKPQSAAAPVQSSAITEIYQQPVAEVQQRSISSSSEQAAASAVNIYGETIASGTKSSSALANAIEKETIIDTSDSPIQQLETVYDAAEKMLKAGYALSAVAKQTRLPLDEVQMLSRIIDSTTEDEQLPQIIRPVEQGSPIFVDESIKNTRGDARLGVLGGASKTRMTV